MLDQEKIIHFLRINGPILPSKVAKNIDTNILIASAYLSDLASQGKVKISNLKIGSSPLYYLPGHEEQLYPFAAGNINPKDQKVLDRLKNSGVLREREQDLLTKVALRSLKDFAIPLHVFVKGRKEVFWKWHLLLEEETNGKIRTLLSPPQIVQQKLTSSETIVNETVIENNVSEEVESNQIGEQSVKKESIKLTESNINAVSEVEEKSVEKNNVNKISKNKNVKKVIEKDEEAKVKEVIKEPSKLSVKPKKKKKLVSGDSLHPIIEEFFNGLGILIEDREIIRKNSEIDYLVKVPAVVGNLKYFCKVKSKKRCDEKDLSSAYMEAQIKKLPLLFLYTNSINKKAEDMLESGVFENVTVKKIE